MPRARKKQAEGTTEDTAIISTDDTVTEPTAGDTSFNPAEFDPALQQTAQNIVQQVADSTAVPDASKPSNGFVARTQASGHVANPSSRRRPLPKLPGTLSVIAADLVVRMIDKGDNMAGIGIRVESQNGRDLTDEEKKIISGIVRGTPDQPSGYEWKSQDVFWHKAIARPGESIDQIPTSRAVAIRLDAENRVQQISDALRQHSADPVGFADRIRQQREQAAEAGRIPA